MIKIHHVRSTNFLGGPEKQILEHINELDEDHFSVSVGSFVEHGGNQFLDQARSRAISAFQYRSGVIGALRDMAEAMRKEDFDVVCSHDYKSAVLLLLLSLRFSFKRVAFVRGRTRESAKIRVYQWLEDQIACLADTAIAVSRAEANRLAASWVFKRSKAPYIVRNAATIPLIKGGAIAAARAELVKEHGLQSDTFIFVSAGRLSPEKGQIELVRAVKIVRNLPKDRQFVVLICGDGVDRQALERFTTESRIGSFVRFVGHRSDIERYLLGMDCMVLPSKSEGLPNILLESMSYGKPSLCTNVGGVPELLEHGEQGLLVSPDAEAIAEAIVDVLDGRFDLVEFGVKAKNKVADSFSFGQQTYELSNLFQRIAK